MEEKSPEETPSTESNTSSSNTVVSSTEKTGLCLEFRNLIDSRASRIIEYHFSVVMPREGDTMNKTKPEYISVRRRIDHPIWNPEKHSYSMQLMQRDLNNGFRHCRSGCERDVLNRSVRPSGHILWNKVIAEVKSDLFNALAETYPAMKMEVFGSALMGIAFKGIFSFFILNS